MLTRIQCFLTICALVCFRISYSEVSSRDIVTEKVLTSSDAQDGSGSLLTEERSIRCTLGSKKAHLRKHDANQVAQYFIKGGPLVGHSHFHGAQDASTDPYDQNGPVGMPHIPYTNYEHPIHSIEAPHISTLHPSYPYGQPHSMSYPYPSPYYPYSPYRNNGPNYLPNPPINSWQAPSQDSLLGSPLNQQPQSMGNGFYSPPSSVLRIPVLNAQDYSDSFPTPNKNNDNENAPNVGAPQLNSQPDEVQPLKSSKPIFEAIIPHIPNQVYGFPQSYYAPTPSNMYHPPPAGYILRLIPHNVPSNTNTGAPTVGASKPLPAESSDNEVYEDAEDGTDEDSSDPSNCTVAKREESVRKPPKAVKPYNPSQKRPRYIQVEEDTVSHLVS